MTSKPLAQVTENHQEGPQGDPNVAQEPPQKIKEA